MKRKVDKTHKTKPSEAMFSLFFDLFFVCLILGFFAFIIWAFIKNKGFRIVSIVIGSITIFLYILIALGSTPPTPSATTNIKVYSQTEWSNSTEAKNYCNYYLNVGYTVGYLIVQNNLNSSQFKCKFCETSFKNTKMIKTGDGEFDYRCELI